MNQAAPGDARRATRRLDARIASYELAAQLQLSAPEVLDLSKETGGDAADCTAWTTRSPRISAAIA